MAEIAITWTPFALRCLDEIHYFISQEAQAVGPADKFIDKIFYRTNQLKSFPESGQEEIFLKKRGIHCRYLVEGYYKIVYEYLVDKRVVVITDIFHTRQDPDNIVKG